jgi:hypothetical protein
MKELIGYRVKMIERMEEAAHEFCDACRARDPFAKTGDAWNAHQIAAHTRDVQKNVYGARILQTLREDQPKFGNFEADEWAKENYKADEPLEKILVEFLDDITSLCRTLREIPQEAWSRESWHEIQGGGLTLQLWVERGLAHIVEHLNSVK